MFREQRSIVANTKVSTGMEPLQAAVVAFLDFEMKKRKLLRESIQEILRKFNWKGMSLSESRKNCKKKSRVDGGYFGVCKVRNSVSQS